MRLLFRRLEHFPTIEPCDDGLGDVVDGGIGDVVAEDSAHSAVLSDGLRLQVGMVVVGDTELQGL